MTDASTIAHPPETIEGWYALHQIFRRTADAPEAEEDDDPLMGIDVGSINRHLTDGWTAVFCLIGSVTRRW